MGLVSPTCFSNDINNGDLHKNGQLPSSLLVKSPVESISWILNIGFKCICHLVMTNIAMENPNHKWRFIAGKIIYKWAIYTMAMLNNQRVNAFKINVNDCLYPFFPILVGVHGSFFVGIDCFCLALLGFNPLVLLLKKSVFPHVCCSNMLEY